jgi:flagellar motor switch/type III secretory pathway protein FliN
VSIEVARVSMRIDELAALAPGEVLATGRSIGERVTLRAGDRAVATGELVSVDGEVGVRVLTVAGA